jgi:predicted nucleic acid-binding protein
MTYFEVVRGLRAVRAARRERDFQKFVTNAVVLPISGEVLETAANVYATLHRQGRLIPDADLVIGATALVHGLAIATNNEDDFNRIQGLTVVNWLRDFR